MLGRVFPGRIELGVVDRHVEPDHAAGVDEARVKIRELGEVQGCRGIDRRHDALIQHVHVPQAVAIAYSGRPVGR